MNRRDLPRLDTSIVSRGLAESREKAQALIMAGTVQVNGKTCDKPGTRVSLEDAIELRGPALPYVSRGGLKLEAALDRFRVSCEGKVALDVGASTGGFTDCLLQRGARKVYAVDVGYGQLHQRLRDDPRVITMERVNARYMAKDSLPEEPSIITMDVSFISVTTVLPAIIPLAAHDADFIILVKPQFEAGPRNVRKGVVRDREVHVAVITRILEWSSGSGLMVMGLTFSPVKGPEGNIEFLLHLRKRHDAAILESQDYQSSKAREAVDLAYHHFATDRE